MPLALLALAIAAAEPVTQVELAGLTLDRQLTALALAGLVNRSGPRLYLDTAAVNWPNRGADAYWRQHYTTHQGLVFAPRVSFDLALARFASSYRGLVVYDPARDGSRWVAMTLAGLDALLPVTPDWRALPALAGQPVVHDLRGRFANDLAAYAWAAAALLPRCAPNAVYSAGSEHDGILLGGDRAVVLAADYGVAERMFFFNLSFSPRPTQHAGRAVPGYADQVAQVDRILQQLSQPAAVWGWCEPEMEFSRRVSNHGHFVVCGAAPNLSFHRGVPADARPLRQKRHFEPASARLDEKTYVTVLTNEGDTPKALVSEYLPGWSEPERGQVPVNWLVNPHLLALFPAMAQHYYDTATDQDYFACAVSGAGYTLLSALPNPAAFGAWTRHYLPFADLRGVDVWTEQDDPAVLARYAAATGAEFLSLEGPGPRAVSFAGAVPISRSGEGLVYWGSQYRSTEALAEAVRRQAAETPRPNFVQIYSGTSPRQWLKLAQLLGADYRFVRLDEYVALAQREALLRLEPPVLYATPGERLKVRITARTFAEREPVEVRAEPGAAAVIGGPLRLTARRGETSSAEVSAQLATGANAGPTLLQVTDSRGHRARARVRVVETGFEHRFTHAEGWSPWPGGGAVLALKDGRAQLANPPGTPFSAVEKRLTLDVDRYPTLLLDVAAGEAACAVKVRPADSRQDVVIVPDTRTHGTLVGNLSATGWHGQKTFHLILFAIGAGHVELERVRLVHAE